MGMIWSCLGESQKSHFPPVCSHNTAINRSRDPKMALWMMTGLSNPCFKGWTLLYSTFRHIYYLLLLTSTQNLSELSFLPHQNATLMNAWFCTAGWIESAAGNQVELCHIGVPFQKHRTVWHRFWDHRKPRLLRLFCTIFQIFLALRGVGLLPCSNLPHFLSISTVSLKVRERIESQKQSKYSRLDQEHLVFLIRFDHECRKYERHLAESVALLLTQIMHHELRFCAAHRIQPFLLADPCTNAEPTRT